MQSKLKYPSKYPKVKCARCGDCCRFPVVPVTHRDLARLMKHSGKSVGELVRFCPSSEMAYDENAGLWIRFKSAKRAMVLRKRRDGSCIFQTSAKACSVYAARPQTCRTFPYSMCFNGKEITEITLNNVMKCNAVKCSKGAADIDTVVANVKKEYREDGEYHSLIKKWNLSHYTGTAKGFLKFIGF